MTARNGFRRHERRAIVAASIQRFAFEDLQMKLHVAAALVFAMLTAAGISWFGPSRDTEYRRRASQATTALPGGQIDCTRGVACPIIWQAPATLPPQ
jgi:hypothetical protein